MGGGIDAERDITAAEVQAGIRRLKNNKALGDTWISAELLKQLSDTLAPALAIVFNHVRYHGTPPSWNKVHLLSLFKKGDPSLPSNYRGLSIMGVLPKLYGTIMTARLDGELDDSGRRAPT